MLGYMTEPEAIENGFTHHGKYFGIPVWVAKEAPDGLVVAAKWAPMEYVMTAFHHIEGFMRSVLFPDEEPMFQFWVGEPIAKGKGKP